ncbi:MAG: hypothetical protein WC637_18910 [Victivallales bacterium]
MSWPCMAEIKVEMRSDDNCAVVWNGKNVTLPSKPALRSFGGGAREWFDPNSRKYCKIEANASQNTALSIVNSRRQNVFLGDARAKVEMKDGGVVYRNDYPSTSTYWQCSIMPVDASAFDVRIEIGCSPEYWLSNFEISLLKLDFNNATCNSGSITSWSHKSKTPESLGPLDGNISICYPNGPNCFVPAAVIQDSRLAMGICLLGAHRSILQDYSELSVIPDKNGKCYNVGLRSSENPFFGRIYTNMFSKTFRFRVSEPKDLNGRPYISMLDAKDLWRDYMDELDKQVPTMPTPARDLSKNNIILMNFFMGESFMVNDRNPYGYLMNDPDWKKNPWEWSVKPDMDEATVRKVTGFGPENFGKPVKWIKNYADKCVKDLKAGNCLAMITWSSSIVADNYAPESQLFNPELEETIPVDGEVRSWDWVAAEISVKNPTGEIIAQKKGALIRAYNPEQLIQVDQFSRPWGAEQRLKLNEADIQAAGAKYLPKAGQRSNKDRLVDKVALILKLKAARTKLLGQKPGSTVTLDALVISDDPELAKEKISIEVKITGIQRAAIDVWTQTLIDAGQEFGFLIREDFTVGMPWNQWCQRFDWTSDWQYKMLKQRFQWHRDRFGEKCRWFYLDVFGNYTPQFVFDMLRNDFPDCFLFAEHPNDGVLRTIEGWNWEGSMNELERYVAPNGLVTILPERIFSSKWGWANGEFPEKDRAVMKKLWRDPHCIFMVHREVRGLLKRAAESGCETGVEVKGESPQSGAALNPDGTIKGEEKK